MGIDRPMIIKLANLKDIVSFMCHCAALSVIAKSRYAGNIKFYPRLNGIGGYNKILLFVPVVAYLSNAHKVFVLLVHYDTESP